MDSGSWHLTEDVDRFLARAGAFLRSRPALHTVALTVLATAPRDGDSRYGWLEHAGEVYAAFFLTPPRRLNVTALTPEQADTLAAHLVEAGHGVPGSALPGSALPGHSLPGVSLPGVSLPGVSLPGVSLPGVSGDRASAAAFAAAWQRHTGDSTTLRDQHRLYRLEALTPPDPPPPGRSRVADVRDRDRDRDHLTLWCRGFLADIGDNPAGATVDNRFPGRRFTYWEDPPGTPVSMAAVSPVVAGHVRIAPVYTPVRWRGRGYASAVTADVSRAALASGVTEIVLFTDLGDATANGLYQRLGYRPLADYAGYDFSPTL